MCNFMAYNNLAEFLFRHVGLQIGLGLDFGWTKNDFDNWSRDLEIWVGFYLEHLT